MQTLWGRLRDGGFTIPFIKGMQNYFKFVSTMTQTDENIPLSMTAKDWALAILIEQMNGINFALVFADLFLEKPLTSADTDTSISGPGTSQIETHATRKMKPLEMKGIILCIVVIDLFLEVSTSSGVVVEPGILVFPPSSSTTRNRGKGKQRQSKSAKRPSKSESSENVSSSESSSKNCLDRRQVALEVSNPSQLHNFSLFVKMTLHPIVCGKEYQQQIFLYFRQWAIDGIEP